MLYGAEFPVAVMTGALHDFLDADVISWQLTKQNENKNEAESVWLGAQVIMSEHVKGRCQNIRAAIERTYAAGK